MFSYSRVVQGLVPFPPEPGQLANVSVFRCGNEHGEPVLAMRISCRNESDAETYVQRLSSASNLMHPNISEVKIVGPESPSPNEHYVFAIVEDINRSLQDEYNEKLSIQSQHYAEDKLWSYFNQLRSALAYMQERNLAHRNIDPSAIRLGHDGLLKLSDFSRVRLIQRNITMYTAGGDKYISPKVRLAIVQGEADMRRIEHDPFKSDVYSLGVIMLQLTMLDLPEYLGSTRGLKENIENTINTDERITRYSEEWRKALSVMLIVDEELRPSFLDLQNRLENPTVIFEDEMTSKMLQRDQKQRLILTLQYGLTCAQLEPQRNLELPCLLTVAVNPQSPNFREVAIDLVCVVDESGSMCESPMLLASSALSHILTLLGTKDRMTIVGFSDTARAKSPLLACTQEGKDKLAGIIAELETLDATNTAAGVQLAVNILRNRRIRDNPAAILLLTDCKENISEDADRLLITAKESVPQLSISCIFVGAETQEAVLPEFASGAIERVGTIQTERDVQAAVETTLPLLLAEKFADISLQIRPEVSNGFSLLTAYSEDGRPQFQLGELRHDQTAYCVFQIQVAPSGIQTPQNRSPVIVTASFTVSWHTPAGLTSEQCEQRLDKMLRILPIPGNRSDARQTAPEEVPRTVTFVYERLYRAKASNYLRKARQQAERGQFEAALQALQHGVEDAESGLYRDSPLVQAAVRDMAEAQEIVRSRESWDCNKHHFLALRCARSLYLDA